MRSELKLTKHSVNPERNGSVVEIWFQGLFIGQVTGADGAGIRVITKYPMEIIPESEGAVKTAIIKLHTGQEN